MAAVLANNLLPLDFTHSQTNRSSVCSEYASSWIVPVPDARLAVDKRFLVEASAARQRKQQARPVTKGPTLMVAQLLLWWVSVPFLNMCSPQLEHIGYRELSFQRVNLRL